MTSRNKREGWYRGRYIGIHFRGGTGREAKYFFLPSSYAAVVAAGNRLDKMRNQVRRAMVKESGFTGWTIHAGGKTIQLYQKEPA